MLSKRALWWKLTVILWMCVIFYLSSQPAPVSNRLSGGITEFIVNTVGKVFPDEAFAFCNSNNTIRKNAHFFTYFILGLLVINVLRKSGVSGYRSVVLALGICFLCAVADEIYQLFIPGRSGQIGDVLIDSIGFGMGIGAYLLCRKRKGKQGKQGDGSSRVQSEVLRAK